MLLRIISIHECGLDPKILRYFVMLNCILDFQSNLERARALYIISSVCLLAPQVVCDSFNIKFSALLHLFLT